MECQNDQKLNGNKGESDIEEIFTIFLRFWSEKSNIDNLINDNVENGERHDPALNYAHTMELCVVHETQIVLVDIVLECEEDHRKDGHIGHQSREDHCNGECRQAIRHMITEIKGIGVYELLGSLFPRLLRIMTAFLDGADQSMRDVKQPEPNWKEHQLDEVSNEKVVVR